MEHAKIFLVDDERDEMWQAETTLKAAGHEVVLQATDLLGAIKTICEGRLQETGVQIAVLDANLRRSFIDPLDGAILAQIIRCLGLPVKVVSRSRLRLPKDIGGYGDQDACKATAPRVCSTPSPHCNQGRLPDSSLDQMGAYSFYLGYPINIRPFSTNHVLITFEVLMFKNSNIFHELLWPWTYLNPNNNDRLSQAGRGQVCL
jgi:hypothetical protein